MTINFMTSMKFEVKDMVSTVGIYINVPSYISRSVTRTAKVLSNYTIILSKPWYFSSAIAKCIIACPD